MLSLRKIVHIKNIRFYSNIAQKTILEPLHCRSLIRIKGDDANQFLQSLITNDINHFNQIHGGSMYTMFLNTKGRVLYDAIIYKIENDDAYVIECDSEIDKQLEKHLKIYRVRKKIDILNLQNDYQIHVLFKNNFIKRDVGITRKEETEIDMLPASTPLRLCGNLLVFKDPRVTELGCRIISKKEVDVRRELSTSINVNLSNSSENYKLLRYSLGVAEGINDLPVANCFPLESNCDYLHGVSFHKGCYIGQELTARTHHTGVVRKRLMPIFFTKVPTDLSTNEIIKFNQINLGKLRGTEQNLGLALLRIDPALELGEFRISNELVKVWKPHWWPLELPKEKLHVQRT